MNFNVLSRCALLAAVLTGFILPECASAGWWPFSGKSCCGSSCGSCRSCCSQPCCSPCCKEEPERKHCCLLPERAPRARVAISIPGVLRRGAALPISEEVPRAVVGVTAIDELAVEEVVAVERVGAPEPCNTNADELRELQDEIRELEDELTRLRQHESDVCDD